MELGIKIIGPVMNMDPRLGMGFTFIMREKMMLQACTKVFVVSCLRWCEIVFRDGWDCFLKYFLFKNILK